MMSCSEVDEIVSSYFKAEDYANDNLPDIAYRSVKRLVVVFVLLKPISRQGKEPDRTKYSAFHELFRSVLDAFFLSGRQLLNNCEKYSGGKLLAELNRDEDLHAHLKSIYGDYIKPENYIMIEKVCSEVPKLYSKLYGYNKDARYPKSIFNYQREHFHQDRHEDGGKYKIISYSDLGVNGRIIKRGDKPEINLGDVCKEFEALSVLILDFATVCEFSYGNILKNCNRYHDGLNEMVKKSASLYAYDYTDALLKQIEKEIQNAIPITLRLISRDIILGKQSE